MSSKDFCDDCNKELKLYHKVRLWIWGDHSLRDKDFCFDCFAKHWKPIQEKFSVYKSTKSI
ncbi:hypothetical protein HYT02_01900 [Candidatus Gottesmanbacteria bacterium]|nr:hypothetical protein [Candidatus Gottesmanbacteria bacterium]